MRTNIYLTFFAGLILVLAGCGNNASETETNFAKITNVETYTLEATTFEDYINLPVVVAPNKQVNLGLTAGGKVTKINVDKGDRVREGKTLLETDDVLLKASFDIAEANLEYQKSEFARSEKLYNEGSITAAAYDGAKLQLSQAENSYNIAKKQFEDAVLKAPFSGIITMRNVEVGDILGPGSPAFRLIDMNRVKVQAGIPEKYIADFKVGNTVTIEFDAVQEKLFEGVINYISPEANPSVRTFLAEILVNNTEGLLRAGIMGDARILRSVYENVILIPINSIIETQNGRIVFVAREDNTAEKRLIEIGSADDTMILVTAGLKPGERIIAKGQHDLVNAEKINITGRYTAFVGEGSE